MQGTRTGGRGRETDNASGGGGTTSVEEKKKIKATEPVNSNLKIQSEEEKGE